MSWLPPGTNLSSGKVLDVLAEYAVDFREGGRVTRGPLRKHPEAAHATLPAPLPVAVATGRVTFIDWDDDG